MPVWLWRVRLQLALLLAAPPAWQQFVVLFYCGCLQYVCALRLWPVLLRLMLLMQLSTLLLPALRTPLLMLMRPMMMRMHGKLVLMSLRALLALAFVWLSPRPLLPASHRREVNLLVLMHVSC